MPVKYSSTSSWPRPIASKTCAPVYDATVEMPIFDITFSTPLPHGLDVVLDRLLRVDAAEAVQAVRR